MEHLMPKAAGICVAEVMRITPEMGLVPLNWGVYFNIADVDATVSQAESLGATLLVPGTDIPEIGRFATIQGPQGAVFRIFADA